MHDYCHLLKIVLSITKKHIKIHKKVTTHNTPHKLYAGHRFFFPLNFFPLSDWPIRKPSSVPVSFSKLFVFVLNVFRIL